MAKTPRHAAGSRLDPRAVWPEDAAKLLTAAAGRRVDVETIRQALAAGAPALPDGRVNVVELAAWLERKVAGSR